MTIEDLIRTIVKDELAKAKQPATTEQLTVIEYASRWSISPSTVRAAIREKRLAVTRIGRAIRILSTEKIGSPTKQAATQRARMRLLRGGSVR